MTNSCHGSKTAESAMHEKIEIFLFRHGMTDANEKKIYCGKSDVPLSEKGREALKKKAGASPDISFCRIYTSGLKRSSESLEILYPNLAKSSVEEKDFQEIDFGDFEMKSYDELKENPEYQKWVQNEADRTDGEKENPCPNGESWARMKSRAISALERILANECSVAIFSHGGIISAIMEHFFPNERKFLYDWQPDFGEGYKIRIEKGKAHWSKF